MSLDKNQKPKMYRCIFQGTDGKMHFGREIFKNDTRQDEIQEDCLKTKWKLPHDEENAFEGKKSNYLFAILVSLTLFIGITLWVNAVKTNWPIWSIMILIVIQLLFYLLILLSTWDRFEKYDHITEYYAKPNFYIMLGIFIVIGVLSKILNLEIIIVPAFAVILLLISRMEKFQKVE